MPDLLTAFALFGAVMMLAALASGIVERAPISFPVIFLGLGFALGERGVGLLRVDAHDPTLEVIGVLTLAFVLFLDAVNLRYDELGKAWVVPVLALGPGALLTLGMIAAAAHLLLALPLLESLLLGTVLASVDPVLLRDVLHNERVPASVRGALKTEAGTNDIVVLPIILILSTILLGRAGTTGDWLLLLGELFVIGPFVGFAVGAVATRLIEFVRERMPIKREYQALYGVGTMLAAYVAGEGVGGSGFLAVFAAGSAVVALDHDLCDCFLEYAEITSEMAMLVTFALFGAALSTMLGDLPLLPTLAFALFVIFVARPVAIGLVLRAASLSRQARMFIAWFGPRGLNSLLFALLVVHDGVPGAERLLAIAGAVVIVSVLAHGISATPLTARYVRAVAKQTLAEEREARASGLFGKGGEDVPRLTPDELSKRLSGDDPPLVLDVRSRSSYEHDKAQIPGSVRVPPDQVTDWAQRQLRKQAIVTYCT